ncbi:MAG: uracil-DNA glycosylase [Candidatus Competibacteraceae bacterium]|nr:MAG: uracil-DNA glycosylase [Candidatus Competibacteraceae bacterium]
MTDDRKREYLAALGIPLWLPRRPLAGHPQAPPVTAGLDASAPASNPSAASSPPAELEYSQDQPQPMAMRDAEEFESLPPDDWTPPMTDDWEPVFETAVDHASTPPAASREARIARMDWEELAAEARQCTACGLCATRTQAVFGTGDRETNWLVIGEAPGADEDRLGEPFVGRAGKLLNPMLLAIGLKREQAYIANILKCRPPENRDPAPAEAKLCRPFLERQIELIRPRIIFALGRIAAQNLLDTDTQIGKLRGRVHHFGPAQIPLVVTYHPAYLLRAPREKRKVWDDLRLARRAAATASPSEPDPRPSSS